MTGTDLSIFSQWSYCLYIQSIHFYVLIVFWESLPDSLMSRNNLSEDSFGHHMYRIITSANRANLISSLFFVQWLWLKLTGVYWTAVVKVQSCLVLDFPAVPHSIRCLLWGFHIWPSLHWGMFILHSNYLRFLPWRHVLFYQIFSLHLLR